MTGDERRAREPGEVEYGELPELTRGLRALGSARRGGTALQAAFFLPLVEGRRRAAESRSAVACLRAFDAAELARSLDRCLDRVLAEWPDDRPAAKRALRARLLERVGDYAAAIHVLGERSADVLAAPGDEQRDAWRRWTLQLAATFAAADRCWISLSASLASMPGPRPRRR